MKMLHNFLPLTSFSPHYTWVLSLFDAVKGVIECRKWLGLFGLSLIQKWLKLKGFEVFKGRERQKEYGQCFFFFFSILCRRRWEGWSGRAARQVGVQGELGEEGWGWAHRIAPTHTPIKSIRIVRDGKKTGNHCMKWSFFYQLLNT